MEGGAGQGSWRRKRGMVVDARAAAAIGKDSEEDELDGR